MTEQASKLIADLPRGRGENDRGQVASAHFAKPEDIAATSSLRFNPAVTQKASCF